jgi:centromeric protein E
MIGTQTSPGIVPLAVQDVFDYIQQGDEAAREYLVRFSYLEIYNEQIIDLLSDTTTSIRILEGKEGVVVRGLREEVVTSPEEIFFLLQKGEVRRQVGSTNMNKHSSRSHAIVRLWLESKSSDTSGTTRVSSLSLVDLAGSESVRLTGSTGERQREGQYINKSLMTLGQVIHKLSENQERVHIPYRDSKLTRLMQSSLSGNAQVVCVCNISSSSAHLEESHNTLKFATRAKKIEQRVKINEVQDQNTLLQEYKEEIEELKQQLAEAKKAQQQQKNEEDVRELISAIHKMEKLILKTQKFQEKKPQVEDDMLLLLSPDSMDAEDLLSTSPEVTTKPSALTNGHAGEPTGLFEEMHRIQGLLDNVLSKRGIPSATKARDDEVKELKSQLHEQEVATTLKKADANFLQHQLQEKDKLLEEVSKILEAVEKRQVELEAQNKNLKRLVIERDRQIAIKQHRIIDCERELVELKSKLSVVM